MSVSQIPLLAQVLKEDRETHRVEDVTGSGRPLTAEAKQIVANVITMLPVLIDDGVLTRGDSWNSCLDVQFKLTVTLSSK